MPSPKPVNPVKRKRYYIDVERSGAVGARRFVNVWLKHAAHNGAAIVKAIYHGSVPPQWTGHTDEQLDYIDSRSLWQAICDAWER